MPYTRRDALRLGSAAAVGLAGCLGDGDPDPVTLELGEHRRTEDGTTATVHDAWVQSAFAYEFDSHDENVQSRPRTEFVFLRTNLECDLSLAVGEEQYPVRPTVGGVVTDRVVVPPDHSPGAGEQVLGVELPVGVTDEDPVVVLEQTDGPTLRWRVGDALAGLGDPPSFELQSFEAPGTVAAGETVPLSLAVTRSGGRAEPFRAAIRKPGDDSEGVTVRIDAAVGERASWSGDLGTTATAGGTAVFVLDLGRRTVVRTVEVTG